ncbi:hypothetical protein AB0J47_07955 [Nocardia sp. NPDC049737]|uniref:hypothetical protein n=1 Tax=Nocardia sp. NPDC049737 TaxID=3154358 RepID=UPI0034348672
MSGVAVAVIVGFILCALGIRALSTLVEGRGATSWHPDVATDSVRMSGDTPYRAMMDE